MATRTTVTLVDDLDGGTAEESVRFGLEGAEYEIDLSAGNAATLRDVFAGYIAAARRRRAGRASSPRPASPTTTSSAAPTRSREENQQIRAWAIEHGAFVPERGRIPGLMVAAHDAGDPSMLPAAADSPKQAQTPSESPPAASVPAPSEDAREQPRGRDGLTTTEREVIRAWAVEEGIEVKTRGQLKKDLIANYRTVSTRR